MTRGDNGLDFIIEGLVKLYFLSLIQVSALPAGLYSDTPRHTRLIDSYRKWLHGINGQPCVGYMLEMAKIEKMKARGHELIILLCPAYLHDLQDQPGCMSVLNY